MNVEVVNLDSITHYIYRYDSIADTEYHCLHDRVTANHQGSNGTDYTYAMTHTFDEAITIMRDGWKEGTQKLKHFYDSYRVTTAIKERKFMEVNSIEGYAPNVPRALCGMPDSMRNGILLPIKTRVVNVFVNVAASASVRTDKMMKRGGAILSFVKDLETKGYRTNIYAMIHAGVVDSETFTMITKVKDSMEPLSLDRVTFPLAHPSFLRRIYMRSVETSIVKADWTHSGYGQAIDKYAIDLLRRDYKDFVYVPSYIDVSENDPSVFVNAVLTWNEQKGNKVRLD